MPEAAADSLTKVLTLAPDITVRPIVAYYLEKMGKPIPPRSKPATGPASSPASTADPLKRDILPVPSIGTPLRTDKPAEKPKAASPVETGKDTPPGAARPGAGESGSKKS